MGAKKGSSIKLAEVVLPARNINETLAFFTDRLSFRIATIYPADNPTTAVLVGPGIQIRLLYREDDSAAAATEIRLLAEQPPSILDGVRQLTAPNGTRIRVGALHPETELPAARPSLVINRKTDGTHWIEGRAGMYYRDLVPDRQGGRFIASHIRINKGGPVADYVHYHQIRFQMIFCRKGWVRVVYEDQGKPFVMQAGDCVLQPPLIRHRVLESSPGLEVIEIGCPAEHLTVADLEMDLPTDSTNPSRSYSGQRFVRHIAAEADWLAWRLDGFEFRDTGIAAASNGLAAARVVRPLRSKHAIRVSEADAEFLFLFVLAGSVDVEINKQDDFSLHADDSIVIPASTIYRLQECTPDLEFLEVSLPAELHTRPL